MIQNMKPDRIQIGPPIDGDLPWTERAPTLSRSFEFDKVRDAALFTVYADEVAQENEEIRVALDLIGTTLTITAKPVSADYLPHAVYEFAAMIDAAVELLRRPRFDHDDFEVDSFEDDSFEDDDFEDDSFEDDDFEVDDFEVEGFEDHDFEDDDLDN